MDRVSQREATEGLYRGAALVAAGARVGDFAERRSERPSALFDRGVTGPAQRFSNEFGGIDHPEPQARLRP